LALVVVVEALREADGSDLGLDSWPLRVDHRLRLGLALLLIAKCPCVAMGIGH
jgi:hypothetical protein